MVFQVIFYFMVGFANDAGKFWLFYLFLGLNSGLMTMLGQMAVSLVRDSATAQGLGGVLSGMISLFAGVMIRPENIPNFW